MGLRLAIGQCNCRRPYSDDIQRYACDAIEAHLDAWRPRLPADLGSIPRQAFETREVDGHTLIVAVHRDAREDGACLVVCQVFVHTWNKPTFLTIGRVGRIYAEGLLLLPDGTVQPAPDDMLWEFR